MRTEKGEMVRGREEWEREGRRADSAESDAEEEEAEAADVT